MPSYDIIKRTAMAGQMKKFPFSSLLLFLLLLPMLFRASDVTTGARNGLLLWYNSVVPTLFPFMVLSGLIAAGNGISQIMSPFYFLLHPLFGISRDGCFVLISGLLCGYPLGAKMCAEFVRDGRIGRSEAHLLMAICNHASPMFILGYVYPYFSMHIAIREMLICVYVPVFMIAAIARMFYHFEDIKKGGSHSSDDCRTPISVQTNGMCRSSFPMDEMILSSVEVLCKIGGYLILFSILIIMIQSIDRIPKEIKLFLIGAMEMTTGIRELAALENWKIGFIASIASLTFGGLSGIFQTKSVLQLSMPSQSREVKGTSASTVSFSSIKKAGLSIRPYVLWKVAHAVLSAGLAYFICMND